MPIIRDLLLIILCVLCGEVLGFYLKFPPSILALIVAFIFLLSNILKAEKFENTANMLLKVSNIFFISYFVNILSLKDILQGIWLKFFAVIILSGVCSMIITAVILNLLDKQDDKETGLNND